MCYDLSTEIFFSRFLSKRILDAIICVFIHTTVNVALIYLILISFVLQCLNFYGRFDT